MNDESPLLANLSFVANIMAFGPKTIAEKNEEFLNDYQKELFCARVVVITGMGNQKSPEHQLLGSIPISEIEDQEFEFFFYQIRPKLEELNLHLICVLSFHRKHKPLFKEIERKVEDIIHSQLSSVEFIGFKKGGFDTNKKAYYVSILLEIEQAILNLIDGLPPKGSLFDLSYISTLDEKVQEVAKRFLMAPTGIEKSKLRKVDKTILKFLESQRLIKFTESDGITFVVAR